MSIEATLLQTCHFEILWRWEVHFDNKNKKHRKQIQCCARNACVRGHPFFSSFDWQGGCLRKNKKRAVLRETTPGRPSVLLRSARQVVRSCECQRPTCHRRFHSGVLAKGGVVNEAWNRWCACDEHKRFSFRSKMIAQGYYIGKRGVLSRKDAG